MKYLRLGLDVPTSRRIGILILIGLASLFVYPPLIYAMIVYYSYFNAWDITSTTDLKLKVAKSLMMFCGIVLGSALVIFIEPKMINLFLDPTLKPVFFKFLIKLFVVYESSVLLFLYIHHFGLHSKSTNSL